jgi:hypothetical protein
VKIKTVIGLAGATTVSLVGAAGLAVTPAGAGGNGAINMPAANLSSYLGFPAVPVFASPFTYQGETGLPFAPPPNTKVSGNCLQDAPWLFTDIFGLNFTNGNAVVYQPNGGGVVPGLPPLPGGLNAEGTAELFDFNSGPTGFVGSAHLWLGQNGNANGQYVAAQTVSFSGTDPAGSTISFTVNPGETHSASGHMSGWGQQNLSCNIVPGDEG